MAKKPKLNIGGKLKSGAKHVFSQSGIRNSRPASRPTGIFGGPSLKRTSGRLSDNEYAAGQSSLEFAKDLKKNMPTASAEKQISALQSKSKIFKTFAASMTAETLRSISDPRIDEKQKFTMVTQAVGRDISLLNRNFKIVQTRIESLETQTGVLAKTVDLHTKSFKSLHEKIVSDLQRKLRREEGMDELYQFKKPTGLINYGNDGADEDDDDVEIPGNIPGGGRRRRRGRRGKRRGQRRNQRRSRSQRRAGRWNRQRAGMRDAAKRFKGAGKWLGRIGKGALGIAMGPVGWAFAAGILAFELSLDEEAVQELAEMMDATGMDPSDILNPDKATKANSETVIENIQNVIEFLEERNAQPMKIGGWVARRHKVEMTHVYTNQDERDTRIQEFFLELDAYGLTESQIGTIVNSTDNYTKKFWDNVRSKKKFAAREAHKAKMRKKRQVGRRDMHPDIYDPPGSGAAQRKRSQTQTTTGTTSAKTGAATQRRKSRTPTSAKKQRSWSDWFWGKPSKLGGSESWSKPMMLGGPGTPTQTGGYKDEWSDTIQKAGARYLLDKNLKARGTSQTASMSKQEWDTYKEKREFLKFGKLPGGFESVPGNMGLLGMPGFVSARGAQPLGGGGGRLTGGYTPTFTGMPTGSSSGSTGSSSRSGLNTIGGNSTGAANYDPPMRLGGPRGEGDAETIQDIRASIAKELKDPRVRAELYARTEIEVGGQGAAAQQAWQEVTINRAIAEGKSLSQTLKGRYYPGKDASRFRRLTEQALKNDGLHKKFGDITKRVLSGSNTTLGATHNASAGVARDVRQGGYDADVNTIQEIGGETFYGKRFKRERALRGRVREASAAQAAAQRANRTGSSRQVLGSNKPVDHGAHTSRAGLDAARQRMDDAQPRSHRPQPTTNTGKGLHQKVWRMPSGIYNRRSRDTGDTGLLPKSEYYKLFSEDGKRYTSPFNMHRSRDGRQELSNKFANITLANGQKLRVNAAFKDRYQGFVDALAKRGYKFHKNFGNYGQVHRMSRGGGGVSAHSPGIAIDLNASRNAMGSSKTDMDPEIEALAAQYGLAWGGRFNDAMHFEPMKQAHWNNYLKNAVDAGLITSEEAKFIQSNRRPPTKYELAQIRGEGPLRSDKNILSEEDIKGIVPSTMQAGPELPPTQARQQARGDNVQTGSTEEEPTKADVATRPKDMTGKPSDGQVGRLQAQKNAGMLPPVPQRKPPEQRVVPGVSGVQRPEESRGAPQPSPTERMTPTPSPSFRSAQEVGMEPSAPSASPVESENRSADIGHGGPEMGEPPAQPPTPSGGDSGGSSDGGGLLGGGNSGGNLPGFRHDPESESAKSGTSGYGSQGRCFV